MHVILLHKSITILELRMEKANKLIDSSSSEDEISQSILQEAIDQQFLKNNLYTAGRVESAPESGKQTSYFCIIFYKFIME